MLRFRKPPRSFVAFLLGVVGIGVFTRHEVDATGIALFCYFVASIDPKPAWKVLVRQAGQPVRRPGLEVQQLAARRRDVAERDPRAAEAAQVTARYEDTIGDLALGGLGTLLGATVVSLAWRPS